jgi:pimeloyl-ACP methyl ester carboxylesterase
MTKTIVMIHGMFGADWCWENFKPYFQEKYYQCHTPTLRYHDIDPTDMPDPRLGTTSLSDYARDLEAYINNLDEKPIIMGHSMGGLLAQILGSRGLARYMVLLAPASPSGINALKFSVIKTFWEVLKKWGFWRNPFRLSFNAALYASMHLLPEGDQKAFYERFVYESGRVATEIGFPLFDPKKAAKVDESKVTCPVLVIAGAKDRMTPASVVQKVANKYKPVSTYKEFENHAHWVIAEPGWNKIAEFVCDWLKKVKA